MTATPETKPTFFSTATLAERLQVSRMTVYRWRVSGYLPPPCFTEGKSTIWSADDIEAWVAAGSPWQDRDLAKQALQAHGGPAGLREFVRPKFEPNGPRESDRATELLDQFERQLNTTRRLMAESEATFRQAVGRMTSLRRELAILRNEDSDDGSPT